MRQVEKSVSKKLKKGYQLSEKEKWLNSLLQENKKPILQKLEKCTNKTWREREKYFIKKFTSQNISLVNINSNPKHRYKR